LGQNPAGRVQGQAENCTQDTEAVTRAVSRWATAIPPPAPYGRTATARPGAGTGSSELLGDYGELRKRSAVHASDAPRAVPMAASPPPTPVVYLERPPSSSSACGLAPGTHARPPQPFCHAEGLNEEPDRGKPFVRFCEGLRHNWWMAERLWHRRETRRQTENTNVTPTAPEDLSLLDKNPNTPFLRRLRHRYRPSSS